MATENKNGDKAISRAKLAHWVAKVWDTISVDTFTNTWRKTGFYWSIIKFQVQCLDLQKLYSDLSNWSSLGSTAAAAHCSRPPATRRSDATAGPAIVVFEQANHFNKWSTHLLDKKEKVSPLLWPSFALDSVNYGLWLLGCLLFHHFRSTPHETRPPHSTANRNG